jgi:hypothetical protein
VQFSAEQFKDLLFGSIHGVLPCFDQLKLFSCLLFFNFIGSNAIGFHLTGEKKAVLYHINAKLEIDGQAVYFHNLMNDSFFNDFGGYVVLNRMSNVLFFHNL